MFVGGWKDRQPPGMGGCQHGLVESDMTPMGSDMIPITGHR